MSSYILLVDDQPLMIRLMARALADVRELRYATTGEDALRMARESPPDLVLLDAEMPGMDGFDVCRRMRSEPALQHVPIIFVTAHSGAAFELSGFEVGAADFIAKPISAPLLVARVRTQLRLKTMSDELRSLASRDGLTGLANRRSFDDALLREWRRSLRSGEAISLLMVDVDHFKLFNDHYGHPAGDACLRRVAEALGTAAQRPADVVARYGGEEFVLLLPETPRSGAELVARSVIEAVHALAIPHAASKTADHVTLSIGIASHGERGTSTERPSLRPRSPAEEAFGAEELVRVADRALYQAKQAGRAQARWLGIDPSYVEQTELARRTA